MLTIFSDSTLNFLVNMPKKRINQIFNELSFNKKLLAVGSLLMIVSVFLPWYQDLDSFKTGDMFLGITGPLYLAGVSLLVLSGVIPATMYLDYAGKKPWWMPTSNSPFYLAVGIFAFYMLILTNSVYSHAKFGVNITMKQTQFGMFLAFIAASLISIGGYLSMLDKKAGIKEFEESVNEPLMQVPHERKQSKVTKNFEKEGSLHTKVNAESIENMQVQDNNINHGADSSRVGADKSFEKDKKTQVYRMDL